jgi:hypothetical protein
VHSAGQGGPRRTAGGYPGASAAAELFRTDVRRALFLLRDGKWLRVDRPTGRRPRAAVQLSRYPCDVVPVGLDVLALLAAAGYVAPGRTLPGGAWRYDLTAPGRLALVAARPPPG